MTDHTHADRGPITPSQTVGPFFAYCLTPRDYGGGALCDGAMSGEEIEGTRIRIEGVVYDGDGNAVPDALVEAWQADHLGRYAGHDRALANSSFKGFGRSECDKEGQYWFDTIRPGPVAFPGGGMQAPHININILAKGLLRQLFTRIYFADEPRNDVDPILALVPEDRRHTLIAQPHGEGIYRLDIRLQGDEETVFLEA